MAGQPDRPTPTQLLVAAKDQYAASEAARAAAEVEARLQKERADRAESLYRESLNKAESRINELEASNLKIAERAEAVCNNALAVADKYKPAASAAQSNISSKEDEMTTIAKTQLSTTDWFLRLLIAAVIVVAVAFVIIWGYHNISWTSPAVVGPIPNPTPAVLVDADPAPVLPAQPAVNYEEAGIVTNVVPPSSCQVANNVITVVGSNYSTATGQFYRPDCGESLATAEIAPTPPPRPAYLENIELASTSNVRCPALGSPRFYELNPRPQGEGWEMTDYVPGEPCGGWRRTNDSTRPDGNNANIYCPPLGSPEFYAANPRPQQDGRNWEMTDHIPGKACGGWVTYDQL